MTVFVRTGSMHSIVLVVPQLKSKSIYQDRHRGLAALKIIRQGKDQDHEVEAKIRQDGSMSMMKYSRKFRSSVLNDLVHDRGTGPNLGQNQDVSVSMKYLRDH